MTDIIELLREQARSAIVTVPEETMVRVRGDRLIALLDLAESVHAFEGYAEAECGYKDGMTLFEHEEFWNEISILREKLSPLLKEA